MIEQPVTFTFGHAGQPAKLTQVVSPPLGATIAGETSLRNGGGLGLLLDERSVDREDEPAR